MTLHPELFYPVGRIEMLPCVSLLRNLRALVGLVQVLKYFVRLEIKTSVGTETCEVLYEF